VRPALRGLSAYRTPLDPPPIKLDANESPWPLPPEAQALLADRLARVELHRYPDLAAREVKRVLAARLGAQPDELVLGVGSDEVIALLLSALGAPRDDGSPATVLVPTPTFTMVALIAKVHGLVPVEVPRTAEWALDVPAMLAAIEAHDPSLIYLASPNNPTANALSEASIRAMLEAAPRSVVLVDEAYGAFAGKSLGPWCEAYPNLAVLGTLSKIGLAGLRLGWGRLHPALAEELEKVRLPYNLNAYAQHAAATLLGELPHVLDDAIARIVDERARLARALERIEGLRVWPSDANFLLVEAEDAEDVQRHLLGAGVAVRRFGSDPRLAQQLRITVGTPDENDALLDALASRPTAKAR
jgi:histidinol-phosphate aminotransferase